MNTSAATTPATDAAIAMTTATTIQGNRAVAGCSFFFAGTTAGAGASAAEIVQSAAGINGVGLFGSRESIGRCTATLVPAHVSRRLHSNARAAVTKPWAVHPIVTGRRPESESEPGSWRPRRRRKIRKIGIATDTTVISLPVLSVRLRV